MEKKEIKMTSSIKQYLCDLVKEYEDISKDKILLLEEWSKLRSDDVNVSIAINYLTDIISGITDLQELNNQIWFKSGNISYMEYFIFYLKYTLDRKSIEDITNLVIPISYSNIEKWAKYCKDYFSIVGKTELESLLKYPNDCLMLDKDGNVIGRLVPYRELKEIVLTLMDE